MCGGEGEGAIKGPEKSWPQTRAFLNLFRSQSSFGEVLPISYFKPKKLLKNSTEHSLGSKNQ